MIMRAFLLLLLAAPAGAAEILSIDVTHEDGRYFMRSETWFDAPRAGVFDVLTDYERFDRISSIYEDSRFEPQAEDGTTRVNTTVKGCVL